MTISTFNKSKLFNWFCCRGCEWELRMNFTKFFVLIVSYTPYIKDEKENYIVILNTISVKNKKLNDIKVCKYWWSKFSSGLMRLMCFIGHFKTEFSVDTSA